MEHLKKHKLFVIASIFYEKFQLYSIVCSTLCTIFTKNAIILWSMNKINLDEIKICVVPFAVTAGKNAYVEDVFSHSLPKFDGMPLMALTIDISICQLCSNFNIVILERKSNVNMCIVNILPVKSFFFRLLC